MEPAFAPDGNHLAFAAATNGIFQVFVADLLTGAVAQVTHRPYGAHQPAWSRDGSLMAFVGLPPGFGGPDSGVPPTPGPGVADLFVIRPDGTGERSVVGGSGGFWPEYYPSAPTFGADPSTVVFAQEESINAIQIYTGTFRNIAGVPTEGTETPSVSPDGSQLVFASSDVNGEGLRVMGFNDHSPDPAHDGVTKLIAESGTPNACRRPAWGPIGLIAYEVVMADRTNISVVPPTGGAPSIVTQGPFDDRNPSWLPGSPPPEAGAPASACQPYVPSTPLTTPVSLTKDVMPIFQTSCAGGGQACHARDPLGNATPNDLMLGGEIGAPVDSTFIFQQIVGQPSVLDPNASLVAPGDPEKSFLMHKVDGDQCTLAAACDSNVMYRAVYPNCGCAMPLSVDGGAGPPGACDSELLPSAMRDVIRAWIAQGAANN
jgi:hypothetical protein